MELISKCKQCGELLPADKFRKYYHREGIGRVCLRCEKINSRTKYLERKGDKVTDTERKELDHIYQLYEYQRALGLSPPRRRKALQDTLNELGSMLSKYKEVSTVVPEELQRWLTCELTEDPDYYYDVYERLTNEYRPVVRVDTQTLLPVYDETHSATLDQIIERFSAYEDNYYAPIGGTR